jgi:WbqC-like protein family
MTLGIMQPYFLPYLGYWQLLSAVDRFVVYDNIEYTKKGWINRNRFLQNGRDAVFTIPLKKASDFLDIVDRSVADDFDRDRLLNQLAESYRKAPFFRSVFPVIEAIIRANRVNLFDYLHHGILATADCLGIRTPIVISSTVAIDHGLRAENKVLALCKTLGADRYINAIGGRELYSHAAFREQGITLEFIRPRQVHYPQYDHPFVPHLSIVDVMMFNSRDAIRTMLGEYDLV